LEKGGTKKLRKERENLKVLLAKKSGKSKRKERVKSPEGGRGIR